VPAAPAAVLLELDAVGIVPLRLLGLIIPPLALGAGEGDPDSYSSGHSLFLGRKKIRADAREFTIVAKNIRPSRGGLIAAGGFEPPTYGL
jgi:hypothetical protein